MGWDSIYTSVDLRNIIYRVKPVRRTDYATLLQSWRSSRRHLFPLAAQIP